MVTSPIAAAPATAICGAAHARPGRFAPSSFPTRVDTPKPSNDGNMYSKGSGNTPNPGSRVVAAVLQGQEDVG
ncbi:Os08g0300401 [Oryza sativa Japonica Group]|uniref:Os08g0300401 protein n=2 Tax=Oryza sativa TaxID=4530 RepID=A0A0P0XF20_ORYSJ|nr:hypothetical protein OsI_28714 [Oryza sativa Indica Group]BAT04809.1 Os08g0300401 [Oryza sativa Japonica Group]